MRLSWLQKTFLRGFTTRWNTTPSDTRCGQDGDLCQKPSIEKLPPELRRQHTREHGLGVFQENWESL